MQPRGVSGGTRRSESNLHHPTFEHYRFTWRETLFFGYKKNNNKKTNTLSHYCSGVGERMNPHKG